MSLRFHLRHIKRSLLTFLGKDLFPIDAWNDEAYESWYASNKASNKELQMQRSIKFGVNPLFSIVVPLYKTPLDYLDTMVQSTLIQTYQNFELILVNASPELMELKLAVKEYCEKDPRVKIIELDQNYGITENTKYGINEAKGDYICFLDHDDYIEPDLLYEYAKAIDQNKRIDMLYCDEDFLEVINGKHVLKNPLFKPDYSPELLLCKNYILHLLCIKSSLLDEIVYSDRTYDGAQDYYIVTQSLRLSSNIVHIPKILYHWRISETSTAANSEAKPYGKLAYRKVIENQILDRWESPRIVSSGIANIYNIWFSKKMKAEKVSVIVSSNNKKEMHSFLQLFSENNSYDNFEIIFVGNDLGNERIGGDSKIIEAGVGASIFERLNIGAQSAKGDYLLFLEGNYFFQTAEPLEQLLALASQDEIGISSPKSLYSDGTNKCYGVAVTSKRIMPLYRGYPDDFPAYQCNLRTLQNVSATIKDGMMISKSIFEKVGSFDPAYVSEVGVADLCKRVIDEGYRVVMTPTVKLQTGDVCPVRRYDNSCNAPDFASEDMALYDWKWPGARAAGDPYFNRNLDQGSSYFQIARSK